MPTVAEAKTTSAVAVPLEFQRDANRTRRIIYGHRHFTGESTAIINRIHTVDHPATNP